MTLEPSNLNATYIMPALCGARAAFQQALVGDHRHAHVHVIASGSPCAFSTDIPTPGPQFADRGPTAHLCTEP